jgi:hypothetical protein
VPVTPHIPQKYTRPAYRPWALEMFGDTATMTAPNLPGMKPAKDSWILRQSSGFGRKSTMRPRSASAANMRGNTRGAASLGSFEQEAAYETGEFAFEAQGTRMRTTSKGARPMTAGSSRPSTGGGTRLSNYYTQQDDSEKDKYGKVLRVWGYFNQGRSWDERSPLGIPTFDDQNTRKLKILLYLVDGTVEMSEKIKQNSGMTGKTFFKRGYLKKADGSLLEAADMIVGNTIDVLGRRIFINRADGFTKAYFENVGVDLEPTLDAPMSIRPDLGAQYATGMVSEIANKAKASSGAKSSDYLAKRAAMNNMFLFHNFQGCELRFTCIALDTSLPPSKRMHNDTIYHSKKFLMIYHLSDSKTEIRVVKSAKSTHDEAPILLKKTLLAKNWRDAKKGRAPVYYRMEDYRCGTVMDVYGRMMLLLSCGNEYTRDWYRDMGIEQQDVTLSEPVIKPVVHPLPGKGDGFLSIGSDLDTLATVYGMPKPARDLEKAMRNQGRQLRSKAKFLTNKEQDKHRVFMITYYLEDDTIQIFEEVIRNSGFGGGSFLKRGKYINLLPVDSSLPREFTPQDIFLGNVISVNGHEMRIMEMDNLSLRFCESYPEEFPLFDTFLVVRRVIKNIAAKNIDFRGAMQSGDPGHTGTLSKVDFVHSLDQLGLATDLVDQELLTILRRFQRSVAEPDVIYYEEMSDLLSHLYLLEYGDVDAQCAGDDTRLFLLHLMRKKSTQWRRLLRRDSKSRDNCILLSRFLSALRKHGINPNLSQLQVFRSFSLSKEESAAWLEESNSTQSKSNEKTRGFVERADIRSMNRLSSSGLVHDSSGDVERRRQELFARNGTTLFARTESSDFRMEALSNETDEIDPNKLVLNYKLMCDSIYCSDWLT